MRNTILYVALIGYIIIASAIAMSNTACTYDEYKGQCKICSIMQTDESVHQEKVIGGPGYAGFEIKFDFVPDDAQSLPLDVYDQMNKSVIGCKNVLELYNSWYPGPKFLQKYNITEGAIFDCRLELIKSGACSPEIIEFKEIDRRDYFESRADGSANS